MKKLILFLSFLFLASGVSFADVQINEGQKLSTAPIQYTTARYGRTGAIATAGGQNLSKDMIVVWDSTSKDGVSVQTSTTSGDRLVAGILMDNIPGSSRDNTAALDESSANWGRLQTWGKHSSVRTDGRGAIQAGTAVCISEKTAGTIGTCGQTASSDLIVVGTALANESSSTVDIMVRLD